IGDENRDRQAIVDTFMRENKIAASDAARVRASFAKAYRDRAGGGQWIQTDQGEWVKKEVALRVVFLDAGNTLVGLDSDMIARRIRAEGRAVEIVALGAAEAGARVRLAPHLAARQSTETADIFGRYVRYVVEELGIPWDERGDQIVRDLRAVNPPF